MLLSIRSLKFITTCAVVGLMSSVFAPATFAQVPTLPAGVEIDPSGVLRMRTFADPGGKLAKQRIAEMRAALDPNLARPSKLRKVSITRLEKAVAESIENGTGLTDDMKYLAGLTKLQYVFVYPETGDIVIAGPAEGYGQDASGRAIGLTSGQSVMELQDLIVALRAFAPSGQSTSSIGCSIDPTQEGLQKMQQFLVDIAGRIQPGDADAVANGLQENLGEQVVSIDGISPKTHFAQVLVEADYRMKLIGIGLERPPVKIVSYVAKASPAAVAANAMERWYFVPEYEAVRVSEDAQAMELVGDSVKLIGENEKVSRDGGRASSGSVNRASQAFVHSFTKRYAELAKRVPVYGQLRNLIDMSIATAFMQEQDYFGAVNWDLGVFNDEEALPVETYQQPTSVESAVNVVWKGNTLMTPIGGGVSIHPKQALTYDNLLEDEKGTVAKTYADVASEEATNWWWD